MKKKRLCIVLIIIISFLYLSAFVKADISISNSDPQYDMKKFSFDAINHIVENLEIDSDDSEGSSNSVNSLYNGFADLYVVNETISREEYEIYKHADIKDFIVIDEGSSENTLYISFYGDIKHTEKETVIFIWSDCTEDSDGFYLIILAGSEYDDDEITYLGDYKNDFQVGEVKYPNATTLSIEFPSDWWYENSTNNCTFEIASCTGEKTYDYIYVDLYPCNDPELNWFQEYWWIVILILSTIGISIIIIYYLLRKVKKHE